MHEGTWARPTNEIEVGKAKQLVINLEGFKKRIYSLLGDDILFDHLDNAIKRMNELIKIAPQGTDWKKGKWGIK